MDLSDTFNNISPLRYPGGKTRACHILGDIIEDNFDLTKYTHVISPFFGGGSFEFYLQNKYKKYIIANDKFTPLFNFWRQVKLNKDEICENLKKYLNVSKSDFNDYQKNIMNLTDLKKQAIHYFVINRSSFNGTTLSGGFSQEASKKRFTLASIKKISNLNLKYVDFYNEDFMTFLAKFDKCEINNEIGNKFIFLDPPYYLSQKSKLYGKQGDLHENFEHLKLFEILSSLSKKYDWMLTYNNCEFIKNLYKNYKIIDVNWSYGMNKTKESSEIVILSKK